jgi:hypothetical protein
VSKCPSTVRVSDVAGAVMCMVLEPSEITRSATINFDIGAVQFSSVVLPVRSEFEGGDWCDVFTLNEDLIGISIGDVCGKNSDKFHVMTALRQTIRNAARNGLDPAQSLLLANAYLYQSAQDEYATAIIALLDVRARKLVFANAGHPAPLFVTHGSCVFLKHACPDLLLGAVSFLVPNLYEIEVPIGALLAFYTNGVMERALEMLTGAVELPSTIVCALQSSMFLDAQARGRDLRIDRENPHDAAMLTFRMQSRTHPDYFSRLSVGCKTKIAMSSELIPPA